MSNKSNYFYPVQTPERSNQVYRRAIEVQTLGSLRVSESDVDLAKLRSLYDTIDPRNPLARVSTTRSDFTYDVYFRRENISFSANRIFSLFGGARWRKSSPSCTSFFGVCSIRKRIGTYVVYILLCQNYRFEFRNSTREGAFSNRYTYIARVRYGKTI